MSEALNEIFDNITKSEEESNAQYEYLQRLKDKVVTTGKKAEEIENQCHSIEMNIAKKIKRLANREVVLLSMNVRNKCLQERIKELKTENRQLTDTMNELKSRLKSSRENLFNQSFELVDKWGFFSQKQRTDFMLDDFQHDENDAVEEINDKFSITCKSLTKNLSEESKKANAESDNMWLWNTDFTEDDDQNWLKLNN